MRNPFRRASRPLPEISKWAEQVGLTGDLALRPEQDYLIQKAMTRQGAHEGESIWRRPDHWRVVFLPQGHLFARFELLPTGDWKYSQPGNAQHEPLVHNSLDTLMAQAELDWAAHWQVLRQADGHIEAYNRAWFLPKA